MAIERFNGSKLGLTQDETRTTKAPELAPESAIRPETPFDRAAAQQHDETNEAKPVNTELPNLADIDEGTVDITRELASEMNARYEKLHPHTSTPEVEDINTPVADDTHLVDDEPSDEMGEVDGLRDDDASPIGSPIPVGYENARDLTAAPVPKSESVETVSHTAPPGNSTSADVEPSLEAIRPKDAPSTIILIAALMEILASQAKSDRDLPSMEDLHFTRENLQLILGNPQIGKSFFEVFKDMLLASEYADLAFDFMFDGPEFAGMDKASLIAGAKFAYSYMA